MYACMVYIVSETFLMYAGMAYIVRGLPGVRMYVFYCLLNFPFFHILRQFCMVNIAKYPVTVAISRFRLSIICRVEFQRLPII